MASSSKALLILGLVLVFVLAVSCAEEALHSSQEDAKEVNPDRYGGGGYGGHGGGYGGGYGGGRGGGYGGGYGGRRGGGYGGGYGGGRGHGGYGRGGRGGHPPEETEEVKN